MARTPLGWARADWRARSSARSKSQKHPVPPPVWARRTPQKRAAGSAAVLHWGHTLVAMGSRSYGSLPASAGRLGAASISGWTAAGGVADGDASLPCEMKLGLSKLHPYRGPLIDQKQGSSQRRQQGDQNKGKPQIEPLGWAARGQCCRGWFPGGAVGSGFPGTDRSDAVARSSSPGAISPSPARRRRAFPGSGSSGS